MQETVDLLPGFNCGRCGQRRCRDFARALPEGATLDDCPYLSLERFASVREKLEKGIEKVEVITGVVDGLQADFTLAPLANEPSCREDLHPLDRDYVPKMGDLIKYRPLGCPITHFAKVIEVSHGIITVHIVGPRNIMGEEFEPKEIGICMVAAFEGLVEKGFVPDVCQTVKFLPHECMMGKVHSGVVVLSEGRRVRIEGIDLKVW